MFAISTTFISYKKWCGSQVVQTIRPVLIKQGIKNPLVLLRQLETIVVYQTYSKCRVVTRKWFKNSNFPQENCVVLRTTHL